MSERTDRVAELGAEWLQRTLGQKNADYGDSYVLSGLTVALWFPEGFSADTPLKQVYYGLLTRMLDKLIRVSNLVLRATEPQIVSESAQETLGDLGTYAYMTAEVVESGVEHGGLISQ